MSHSETTLPTINDILHTARLLPGRPQFWTSDQLAEFYQTTPAALMQQFRRNPDRFPDDFWFELRADEKEVLVTQNVLPNRVNRGILIGFTRAGTLALSGVLKTAVADAVSVTIIRAFVAMEHAAIADAREMVGRLQVEAQRKKPIYGFIAMSLQRGLSIDRMWRAASYPRWKLEQAAREMLAMRLIDRLPDGMQPDLFGNA